MKIVSLTISNFRGIKTASLSFDGHTALVGDNNTGKSTILEAIDLVLGPDRLSKSPIINEHDFFAGQYLGKDTEQPLIQIELIVNGLNDEQKRHFRDHLEWWDNSELKLLDSPPPEATDGSSVSPALRVKFEGFYDEDEDDFRGYTYCCSPVLDSGELSRFNTRDKRICGFLFLRTLRTGSRALSLEKGSLLDIILRLREIRPKMWEDVLTQLKEVHVAENPELGITDVLTSVQEAIGKIVPLEWADNPRMLVSNLTREHLRKILTVFMSTGIKTDDGEEFATPFHYQGTGTINTLVLALLSMIAEHKQNVIFAMEEPEIAIPPYTQKSIINSVISKSAQAIFTSHSPYVLEEFDPKSILVVQRNHAGELKGEYADYPPAVKPKKYREEFRKRFCEALLSRRVLITEGRTEYDAFQASARRLKQLNHDKYSSLEELGISVISAETETQIAPIGDFYKKLGKEVFAVFDKQDEEGLESIKANVDHPFESAEKGFEKVLINESIIDAIRRYAINLVNEGQWPPHLSTDTPSESMEQEKLKAVMLEFFKDRKGSGEAADFLMQCSEEEMPIFLRNTINSFKEKTKKAVSADELSKEVPSEDGKD